MKTQSCWVQSVQLCSKILPTCLAPETASQNSDLVREQIEQPRKLLLMKNKETLRARRTISQLVSLVLITLFAFTPGVATHKGGFIQTSEDDLSEANKAIFEAQGTLDKAREKKSEALQATAEIRQFNKAKGPEPIVLADLQSAVTDLRRIASVVSQLFDEAEGKPLQTQLQETQTKLEAAKDNLKAIRAKLEQATSNPEIELAKDAVDNKLLAIDSFPNLSDVVKDLNEALGGVYDKVKALGDTVDKKLLPFKQDVSDPGLLFNLYQNNLADLPSLIQLDQDLQERWQNLAAALQKAVSDHDVRTKPVDSAVANVRASVATAVNKITAQIATLAEYAKARDGAITATAQLFKSDPKAHEGEALDGITEGGRVAAALDKINNIVNIIGAQAEAGNIAGFDKTKTQSALRELDDKVRHLSQTAATLQETLSGDRSLWITEKIRLYYFTDIPRLVKTLNPTASLTGGDADARRRADDRLQRLRAAEDAQSEASSEVSSLKRRVTMLRQQLQQAKDDLDLANVLAQTSASKDAELNRRPAADVSNEKKERSLEEKNKREKERIAAQQRADRVNDENNGLVVKLTEAEARLEAAQADFERTSNTTIRAAQIESAAFANARDNAPFWFAGASAVSSDPARRVEITSSTGGENAIFIRGRREDIVKVQDIVAELDEPAPQARMTLWKIELNSDATKKGADKFNKSLEIVEQELASTRAKIAAALSLLIESINEEAETVAAAVPTPEPTPVPSPGVSKSPIAASKLRTDCEERALYTKYGFQFDSKETDISGRIQRLKRYQLYSPQVRAELGVDFANEVGFENPKQFGLKDPASATTLNEALIVLLLTDREHRKAILDNFEDRLAKKVEAVTTVKTENQNKQLIRTPKRFARLDSMLNIDSEVKTPASVEMTRQQEELVYAIRGLLLKHMVGRIIGLQSRIDDFVRLHNKAVRTAPEQSLYECLQVKLPKILDTIHDEFPISPVQAMNGDVRIVPSGESTIALQRFKDGRPFGPPQIYNLRPSPARVAAADGMLDVFTKAFEDDVDREYVQPMLRNLRERLKKTGIGFGTIQRTSVLATNRLVARVDPRATAELAVGEETNLIHGLQQISQLTLAAQTGGAAGVLGAFRSQTNEERPPEIYGITSGSAFQVTPIFDPTGQALRFKFDFVDTTLVREPRGTINPRLPRVERHTVNTEVQLANLEIREVSRFESDSKIGLPTTYKGGLPILKDIPGVRPVPFIGWFVRRKGSNAIAQRSLIFAQTTMSPTIGDILDLLDTSLQRR